MAIEAERSMLYAAIAYPEEYLADVTSRLKPEMLVDRQHRMILKALAEMQADLRPVDLVNVCRRLEVRGWLQAAGGRAYVGGLFDGLYVPVMCPVHVASIIRDFTARRVAELHAEAQADDTPEETRDRLRQITEALEGTGTRGKMLTPGECEQALLAEVAADQSSRLDLGWPVVDRLVRGFRTGELFTIVARPKVGKTALAMNVCRAALTRDPKRSVVFYSLEISADAWWIRWLQMWRGAGEETVVNECSAGDPGIKVIRQMCPNLRIVAEGRPTVADIAADLRDLKPDLVVIDHVDFLTLEGAGGAGNSADNVRATFVALKGLAKQLHTRMLVLHQGLRGDADDSIYRAPIARGSSGAEESSDLVLGAWRVKLDEKAKNPEPDQTVLKLAALYARRSAPFTVQLRVVPDCWLYLDENVYHDLGYDRKEPRWTPKQYSERD